MLTDFLKVGALAKAGDVLVLARVRVSAPGVVGVDHLADVLVRQFPVHPVHHLAHAAGVDKEHLATPVPEASVALLPRQDPQAARDLGGRALLFSSHTLATRMRRRLAPITAQMIGGDDPSMTLFRPCQ